MKKTKKKTVLGGVETLSEKEKINFIPSPKWLVGLQEFQFLSRDKEISSRH